MATLLGTALGGGAAGGFGATALEPLNRAFQHGTNYAFPNIILEPVDLIDLYHRGGITYDAYYWFMKQHGYEKASAKALYFAKDALVTPEQAVQLLVNDRLDLEYKYSDNPTKTYDKTGEKVKTYANYLIRTKRQGYRGSEAKDLFYGNRPVPTFSTLLDWMSKEVFEPDQVTQFKLAEEQPVELNRYFGAYGTPESEAEKYWIAHWKTIGRASWDEMYQRFRSDRKTADYSDIDDAELLEAGVTWDNIKITPAAYASYYRVLELSPYFRDRGKGAVYKPLPFTILQALWQYGVLDYPKMVGRLRDYGYSKRSSELILEAWTRKYPYGSKEPFTENTLYKFSKQIITEATVRADLKLAKIPQDVIDYQIQKVKDNNAEIIWKTQIATLTQSLLNVNKPEVYILAKLNTILGTGQGNRAQWELEVIKGKIADRAKKLSARYAIKAVINGQKTEAELRTYLIARFVASDDIDFLIASGK